MSYEAHRHRGKGSCHSQMLVTMSGTRSRRITRSTCLGHATAWWPRPWAPEVRRHRDRSLFGGSVFVKLTGHVGNATVAQAHVGHKGGARAGGALPHELRRPSGVG